MAGNLWKIVNSLVDRPHAHSGNDCESTWSYPRRQTIHDVYNRGGLSYGSCQRILRENVRRKQPEMWKNGDRLLHHDNLPAYTSLVVKDFLTKNNMTTVPQPAYSPELAPW